MARSAEKRIGTPDENKRHVLLDGGRAPPRMGIIRALLDWLDAYLGPVAPPGLPSACGPNYPNA